MHNWIEYGDNYSKTFGILWHYCRINRLFDTNGDTDDFNAANATTNLFNCKAKITGQTGHNGTKNAEKMVPLK